MYPKVSKDKSRVYKFKNLFFEIEEALQNFRQNIYFFVKKQDIKSIFKENKLQN